MNHYEWLEKNLPDFFEKLGLDFNRYRGCIVSDGDKAEGYKSQFEKAGLHYYHGVAIYLLSNIPPFSKECRNTADGWVSPVSWVIENRDNFLPYLNKIED